jgi:hypothetical protein
MVRFAGDRLFIGPLVSDKSEYLEKPTAHDRLCPDFANAHACRTGAWREVAGHDELDRRSHFFDAWNGNFLGCFSGTEDDE